MSLEKRYVSFERIRKPQIVIGRDQPDVLAARLPDAMVVIAQMTDILLMPDVAHSLVVLISRRNGRSVVRRAVVHQQHFQVAIGLAQNRVKTLWKKVSQFVTGNDEANGRVHVNSSSLGLKWMLFEGQPDCGVQIDESVRLAFIGDDNLS